MPSKVKKIHSGVLLPINGLNLFSGQPMKVDILAFTQGGKRTISFMSQALGLMADLDVGTDNLRWMGESRFLYGLLRGSKRALTMFLILRLMCPQY